mgnify:CR=1 FL=1
MGKVRRMKAARESPQAIKQAATGRHRAHLYTTSWIAVVLAFAAFWFLRADAPAPAQRPASPSQVQAAAASSPGAPERLRVKVVSVRPHDRTAYTQGLLVHDGALYESTGLYGGSSVRQVDPATGELKRSRTAELDFS